MSLRRYLGALALIGVLATPSLAEITYAGGDGSSKGAAVVIVGAGGTVDGIGAEHRWLADRFPGHKVKEQALIEAGGKAYDVMTIRHKGKTHQVFFDITTFFGKI